MKIVVLGAGGMLGHVVGIYLKEKYPAQVILSARRKADISLIDAGLQKVDLTDTSALRALLEHSRPCIAVNCAAITDPRQDQSRLKQINSVLPQTIADTLDEFQDGSRLIHISTDGVFRGDRGQYREDDVPDAEDAYGISKRAGEITRVPHLTIRTSIIGPDPVHSRGLMNWLLSQSGEVAGFRRVLWNGVTTLELGRFIDYAITQKISGLYHLGGPVVSKYDLLVQLKELFHPSLTIRADNQKVLNRTLSSNRNDVSYAVSSSSILLQQLKLWVIQHPQVYSSIPQLETGILKKSKF